MQEIFVFLETLIFNLFSHEKGIGIMAVNIVLYIQQVMNLLPVDLCCTKHFFRFFHYIERTMKFLRGPNNIKNNKIFCSNTFYCALLRKVHEENACCTLQLDSPIRLLSIFQSNSTTLSNLFVFIGNIC